MRNERDEARLAVRKAMIKQETDTGPVELHSSRVLLKVSCDHHGEVEGLFAWCSVRRRVEN